MRQNTNRQRSKAILFDLDGVIAATEAQKSETHVETVLRLGGARSQKLIDLYVDVIGLSYEETRDRYLECANLSATAKIKEEHRRHYQSVYRSKIESVKLAPGAYSLLQTLAGRRYRIGLVSSAHPEEIATILRRHQIERFFDAIVTAESVINHKPAPDPYLKALELLHLVQVPNVAIVFEDTWAGIAAAKAAHLPVFAVLHPFNRKQDLTGAERVFESLADDRILPAIEAYLSP
jgi:putative hydrolase of the HAD superfamily